MKVHIWTINDEKNMQRLIDLGVDGIMTDKPEVLKTILLKNSISLISTILKTRNPGIKRISKQNSCSWVAKKITYEAYHHWSKITADFPTKL